jgi:hypothetical protein
VHCKFVSRASIFLSSSLWLFTNGHDRAWQVVVHDLEVPVSSFGIVKPILGHWLGKLTAVSDSRKDGAPAGV